jgi:beta-aspartyl-peptidase (threonine type)
MRHILVLSIVVCALPAMATAADDAPERGVRELLETQQKDWNRGDLDAFLNGYWNSPKVVFFSGAERREGWETLRDRFHKRYREGGAAMGRLQFSNVEVEALAADRVFARGAWRLTMPDGSSPHGLFTLIVRKQPEGWRIVHDHTSGE